MTKIESKEIIDFLSKKWKHPCPMCGVTNWSVQDKAFELREFHGGNFVIGAVPIIPVIPVICSNCGNTILVNALVAKIKIDPEKDSESGAN